MSNTPTIRLTKEFHFEAAHALWNYDGPCRNIHGHSYRLFVTVKGRPVSDEGNPKQGMLIDFSVLKKIVHELIVDPFDHALMINADTPHLDMARNSELYGKLTPLPYQPTCENMIRDFASKIRKALPPGVQLHSLRLHETATSYAEWYAEDNPDNQAD